MKESHSAESALQLKVFTAEQIDQLDEKLWEIYRVIPGSGDHGTRFSFNGREAENGKLGINSQENSPLSRSQFIAALTASDRISPENVRKIGEHGDILDLADWEAQKVLSDLKILDLGCGVRPYFTYLCRRLGATVYTADLCTVEEFQDFDNSETNKQQAAQFHIVVDLDSPEAIQLIREKTGGDFNFVTSAHLRSGATRNGREVASGEAKTIAEEVSKNAVYYNGDLQEFEFYPGIDLEQG